MLPGTQFCVAPRGIWNEKTSFSLSLAKSRENAKAVSKTYKLFIYVDTQIHITHLQYGLVLWRLLLRRFTFTTLVEDRELSTCGASLSQLRRPFSIQCVSSSFPMCMSFFLFYFGAVLLIWLWFVHPWRPSKRQKRRKNQNSWRILSWCLLNHGLGLPQQTQKWFDWYFFQLCV